MRYNLRWLVHTDANLIKELAKTVYQTNTETYGPNLHPQSGIYNVFLVPEHVTGSEYRRVVGLFNEKDELVMAMGVRQMYNAPSWLLSWTVSNCKTATFISAFKQALNFACEYFEGIGCDEFYVVHPTEKEKVYQYVIKYMREKYWTFVQMTVPKHTKCEYSFYWALMGYQLYQYEISIRRYIKKRPQDV